MFGTVFVPVLLGILLFARAWLPALMVVAVLQAASVVNVDLALWLGPGAGLGVYGITPYNAVALCMGVLLLGRLVSVGVAVPVQVRGAAAWFVAYPVVVALGAVVLPRVFAATPVHEMLALYGMSQPPVPLQWSLSNLVQAANLGVGMGSNRASSFMASLVSNTGVLGALLFCSMLASLLWRYFKTPRLSDIQLFVGVSLATATLAMSLGIPDLNLPMYWGFIFLAFIFCPEPSPSKSGSDPN